MDLQNGRGVARLRSRIGNCWLLDLQTRKERNGESLMTAKYPEILVRLTGPGNDFCIVDNVTKALRNAGVPEEEIDEFCDEALSTAESDLLEICGQWVALARGK